MSMPEAELSRSHTIGTMWNAEPPPAAARVWAAAIVWLAACSAHVAFVASVRPGHFLARLFGGIPTAAVVAGAGALCAGVLLWGLLRRDAPIAQSAGVMLAFVAGQALYFGPLGRFYLGGAMRFSSAADGLRFSSNRLLYLAAVGVPMALAWVLIDRRIFSFLRPGDMSVVTRWSRKEEGRWSRFLGGLALVAGLPAFLLLQASVGFRPIWSGAILAALPAILIASLVNAFVEEAIFRGLVQPAAVRLLGFGRGLWVQGLFFGLIHWGASVGVLSALPVSLAIGVGSVVFGKSVLETRGLSWATLAHALFDVAVFSAYFVR